MISLSSLKNIPFKFIKFSTLLNLNRLPNSFNIFQNFATLKDITRAFLITRTYQSSPEVLTIEFNDALSANLYYAWLRDSCNCKRCIHPESQQKLFDTTLLKLDITPRFCHVTNKGDLKIVWLEGKEDHVSLYDPYWLHRYALGFENNLYEMVHDPVPSTKHWTGKVLADNLPEMEYEDVMQSQTALNLSLQNIHKYGILIMRNVPCVPGEVAKVMNRIANIKQTKWGLSFQVIANDTVHSPACVTTPKTINYHTDLDYLEKSPGLQAIHCLESDCDSMSTEGKKLLDESYFVDGFFVAEWLKKNYPKFFNVLTSVPVKFRLYTENMKYLNYQPIVKLNRSQRISEVHFNTRLMAPLEGPSRSILDFYAAFKMFGEYIKDPINRYSFSFRSGDMVILNNRRILHGGNTLHFSKMKRHFEASYADLDEVLARYRSFFMCKHENTEK